MIDLVLILQLIDEPDTAIESKQELELPQNLPAEDKGTQDNSTIQIVKNDLLVDIERDHSLKLDRINEKHLGENDKTSTLIEIEMDHPININPSKSFTVPANYFAKHVCS